MGASGLGSLLVKEGFLTEQDRQTITNTCGQGSWAFAKSILAMGLLDEDELAAFFAERTRYQIAPKDFLSHLDQEAVQSFDKRLVSKLEVIPLKKELGKITVGVVDPLDRGTLKQLEFFTGLEVNPVVVPLSQLYEGLHKIDPSFRLQSTALTHFLQNHAQSAWVRQKLDTEQAKGPAPRPAASLNQGGGDEDLFEEVTEIEELDDTPIEMEEIDGGIEMVEDSGDDLMNDSFVSSEDDSASEDISMDPFAGVSESLLDDEKSEDEVVEDDQENELDLGGSLRDRLDEDAEDTLAPADPEESDLFSSLDDETESEDSPVKGDDEMDSEEEENSLDADMNMLSSVDDDLLSINEMIESEAQKATKTEAEIEAGETLTELTSVDSPEDKTNDEKADFEMPEVSTFGFEETTPRGVPSQAMAVDNFDKSFDPDDTSEPLSDDILDSLDDDKEPSLDLSALVHENGLIDDKLLADLHPAGDRDIPISQLEGPIFTIEDDTWSPAPEIPQTKSKSPSFSDEEETHINLHAARSPEASDDDIELHPKKNAARLQKDSGLNPTSSLNELILQLSLTFSADAARELLELQLPKIGRAGCLLNTSDHRQILWTAGKIIPEQLGPAAIHPMLASLDDRKWKYSELKATESWTGEALKARIYRDGNWLWAHSLIEANDSAIFRETVESVVSQVEGKIGSG